MHRPSPSTTIALSLPAKDHRAYCNATSILSRLMGRRAPDTQTLILHNLCGRDAAGLADEYLDSIGWPRPAGRAVCLRRRNAAPSRALKRPPFDSSRN